MAERAQDWPENFISDSASLHQVTLAKRPRVAIGHYLSRSTSQSGSDAQYPGWRLISNGVIIAGRLPIARGFRSTGSAINTPEAVRSRFEALELHAPAPEVKRHEHLAQYSAGTMRRSQGTDAYRWRLPSAAR
jgi:hypothetical protein